MPKITTVTQLMEGKFRHPYEIKNCREVKIGRPYADNKHPGTSIPPDNVKASGGRR